MSKALRPCPFCGGEAETTAEYYHPQPELGTDESGMVRAHALPKVRDGWVMECKNCGARGPHLSTTPMQSREAAKDAWYNRLDSTIEEEDY